MWIKRDWQMILRSPDAEAGTPLADGESPSGESPTENIQDARSDILEMETGVTETVEDTPPTEETQEEAPTATTLPEETIPEPEAVEATPEPTPDPKPEVVDKQEAPTEETTITGEQELRNEVARLYGLLGRQGDISNVDETPAQPQQEVPIQPTPQQMAPQPQQPPAQQMQQQVQTPVQPQQYVQPVQNQPQASQNLRFVDDDLHTQVLQSPEALNQVLTTATSYVMENMMTRIPELVNSNVTVKMDQMMRVTDFYRANPDLVDLKEAVKGIAMSMIQAKPDITLDELYDGLGGETRKRLNMNPALQGQVQTSNKAPGSVAPPMQNRVPTFAPSSPAARPAEQIGSIESTVRDQIQEMLAL